MYNRYPTHKVVHSLSALNQVNTFFFATCLYHLYMIHSLSIHHQGMSCHSPTTDTLRIPTSFLLVLLINQHTLNHHTLQQETCTHLRNTHLLPRSHDLILHNIPTFYHTSTLELKCKNQVAKVTAQAFPSRISLIQKKFVHIIYKYNYMTRPLVSIFRLITSTGKATLCSRDSRPHE